MFSVLGKADSCEEGSAQLAAAAAAAAAREEPFFALSPHFLVICSLSGALSKNAKHAKAIEDADQQFPPLVAAHVSIKLTQKAITRQTQP